MRRPAQAPAGHRAPVTATSLQIAMPRLALQPPPVLNLCIKIQKTYPRTGLMSSRCGPGG